MYAIRLCCLVETTNIYLLWVIVGGSLPYIYKCPNSKECTVKKKQHKLHSYNKLYTCTAFIIIVRFNIVTVGMPFLWLQNGLTHVSRRA